MAHYIILTFAAHLYIKERMPILRLFLFLFIFPISLFAQHTHTNDSISIVQDTITLKEVSVSASQRTKVSGMLTGDLRLHVDDLKSLPAMTGTVDILKILELTPSVRTSGEGSSNMYVRGGDAGQNQILYNNIVTYTPGHVLGMFPLFNADHLSWVKMSKSGADAEHGNFISSVVEVSGKKHAPAVFSIKGNAGLLASQVTLDIPLSKQWGMYLSGRKAYVNLLLKELDGSINSKPEDRTDIGYDFGDTNITLIGRIDDDNELSVDVMLGEDRLKINDQEIVIDGTLRWYNTLASTRLSSRLSEDLHLEQSLSFSRFNNKLDTKQEEMLVDLQSKIEDISYKNKFSYTIGQLPFTSGVSYTLHNIKPHDLKLINSDIATNSVKEDRVKANAFSAYMSFSWQPIDRLTIQPGLRYNLFASKVDSDKRSKTFHSLDTRLSLKYQLNESIFFRSNYSHNNQYVNKLTPSSVGLPTDFWVSANQNMLPQRGDEVSLGYYQTIFDGLIEVSADVYYRSMHNLTEFDYNFIENDNESFVDKISYGSGRAYGLELMVKKNYDKLTGWLSYAIGKADRKFENINLGQRFPARFDRRHDLSATLNYKFDTKWDLALTYIYATGNTYTQPTSWYFMNNMPVKEYTTQNNARMPNYNRADIGLNYWFRKDNGLNLSIYNMFAVNNPIYVFMTMKQNQEGDISLRMKRKNLFTIMPSISWNFKF